MTRPQSELEEGLRLREEDICPCGCHFGEDCCTICTNDYADLCSAPVEMADTTVLRFARLPLTSR